MIPLTPHTHTDPLHQSLCKIYDILYHSLGWIRIIYVITELRLSITGPDTVTSSSKMKALTPSCPKSRIGNNSVVRGESSPEFSLPFCLAVGNFSLMQTKHSHLYVRWSSLHSSILLKIWLFALKIEFRLVESSWLKWLYVVHMLALYSPSP